MIKVSIIMPCYNVEQTILRALNSIAMQQTDFDYEIIVADDASADGTVRLAEQFAKENSQTRILRNEQNKGNAYTYYKGLCAARGKYICVLDGDDYYTIPDKLQRQADFLDADVNEEYVGTASWYLIDLGNQMVSIPERSGRREFSYADFLTQNSGYYHTATYMYRNIFKGNVPSQMGEVLYRGDTPRTMFHLMYSGKKIKILDFVGSAYTFEYNGIWSGLKQKEQFEYQIRYQQKHRRNVSTDFERMAADRLIEINRQGLEKAEDDVRRYPALALEQAVQSIRKYAGKFAFEQKDFVLQHVYYSAYMDTLCASLGYVDLVRNTEHIQTKADTENICIFINTLNPHGGGIFQEICELADLYLEKNVYLFVTNMDKIPKQAAEILEKHSNVTVVCPPEHQADKFFWLRSRVTEIAPYRAYYYCSHNDAYSACMPQNGMCENIVLFSFDHGYVCGISNPNIDVIIAKRPSDYWMLKKRFGKKVIYIPTWNKDAAGCEGLSYLPFDGHKHLVTASGAARFYKVDGRPPYRYMDLILLLMKKTGGTHYHFGDLPEEIHEEIRKKAERYGVKSERFVHIPWSENIPLELLERHVDIFIEPFPIVSYKLTLEVLSVGVPVIVHKGWSRMSIADFVPKDTLVWKEKQDFIRTLTNLDSDFLKRASENAARYFQNNHSMSEISKRLYENRGIELQQEIVYPDNTLMDLTDSLRLFGEDFRIELHPADPKQKDEKKKLVYPQNISAGDLRRLRKSKAFRLGFAFTFPVRFGMIFMRKCRQFGVVEGIKRLKGDEVLFYKGRTKGEEWYMLQHSIALRIGEKIAGVYRDKIHDF